MHRERGFTLLELLVSLAVAGVLATVAIPDFAAMLRHDRAVTAVNVLAGALNFARASAISRNSYVTLCHSADGSRCDSSHGWESGWLVFINLDRDSPAQVDAGEPILHVHASLTGGARILGNRAAFTFRPLGVRSTNGTLLYCSAGGEHDRALVVSVTGRIRLADPATLDNGMSCGSSQ
ncbi:MAG TPA: GspH/FimT family pseudopilin [Gammaproteobacteria bacterium]|nr:GspH/FimT family pseudopilin [Gammaproteobacteria bacterium]